MLNGLAREINQIAKEHGWWKDLRTFGDIIALIHSEASEALEYYRNSGRIDGINVAITWDFPLGSTNSVPHGISIEFADIIIRVLDACHQYGIDIDEALKTKMEYNKSRPFRHGGKRL